MSKELDVVVFGASGYTGKLVVEYLKEEYGDNDDLKWAIEQGITIISTDKFYKFGMKGAAFATVISPIYNICNFYIFSDF